LVRCPFCGYEGGLRPLKTWGFRLYGVKRLECPKSSGRFRCQADPTGAYGDYVARIGVYAGSKGRGS
jgi:hypothetical protein